MRPAGAAGQSPSRMLASYASGLSFADISEAAIARMKLCLLDAVACGVYGATLPWGQILSDYVLEQGGVRRATVWGRGEKVPASLAGLVNGTLIHGFELDDLHKASILHPSSVAIPAALSLAESGGGASGREFLTACVAGFEVGARVGMSVGTSHLVRGFHPTGTNGTVAAAAAAGRMLTLDEAAMENAISIAATQAAGLMSAQFESMVKRMHAGRAAQAGIYGAELAARGFTGICEVFEQGYGGYCSTLSDAPEPALLTRGLGETFETEKVGFKVYSCCGSCHTSVEAAKRLVARHGIHADEIERVVVSMTRATLLHVGWPYVPQSVTTAQMNLPYCLAVTLIDGDAFVEQFSPSRIVAEDVIELAGRVESRHEESFDALGPQGRHKVRIRVKMKYGDHFEETVEHAKGSDRDPLSHDEVVAKFFRLVVPVRGRTWAEDAHRLIMSFENCPSTMRLSELLADRVSSKTLSKEETAHV